MPPPYGRWPRAMDAVMLRALDSGRVDGDQFFSGLFGAVPATRLLRFLDGTSHWYEDVLVGLRTPVAPMLRTVAELPFRPRREAPPVRGAATAAVAAPEAGPTPDPEKSDL